jgi:hypothetical protein
MLLHGFERSKGFVLANYVLHTRNEAYNQNCLDKIVSMTLIMFNRSFDSLRGRNPRGTSAP